MTICSTCGYEAGIDARFCANCGEKLQVVENTSSMPSLDDTTLTNELNSDDIAAIEALPPGSALLVVLKGPGAGARFLVNKDRTIAGRSPDSDIFLDDITVSRAHAGFTAAEGSIQIEDLGSLNGTYVNRELLRESVVLKSGDEVQIGKFKMIIFIGSSGTE